MKISTKGIYAIEAMADLAIHSVDGVESIKNIATRRQLSEKYLEQIMASLRKEKFINSTRGANGGYQLAKPAESITIFEILHAVENSMVLLDCLEGEADCGMDCHSCGTRPVWATMWDKISKVMETVTLADVVKESKTIGTDVPIEYYI